MNGIFEELENESVKKILERINRDKNGAGCLSMLFAGYPYFIFVPLRYLWFGFILMCLWNWFIPLAPLSFVAGMGIWLIVDLIKYNLVAMPILSAEDEKVFGVFWSSVHKFFYQFFTGGVFLAFGLLFSFWM